MVWIQALWGLAISLKENILQEKRNDDYRIVIYKKILWTWKEIGMERDSSLNCSKLKYLNFANFTKICDHVKALLEYLSGPWKVPIQIGEWTWSFINFVVNPLLNVITSGLLHITDMITEYCTIKLKLLWCSDQTISTNLTVHPLQSPSISRKFHNPIGLLSKYVSPIQPVNVITRTASAFCREKYNIC